MEEFIDLEKLLLPNCNVLKVEDECVTAQILDAELDVLDCSFGNDECVTIKTEGLTYITLTRQNLRVLKKLIKQSEKEYKKIFQNSAE
jgi:hypothetical protein